LMHHGLLVDVHVPRKRPKITGEGAWRAASLRQPHIRWHGCRVAVALRELVAIDRTCKLRAGPRPGRWAGVVSSVLAAGGCFKIAPPRGSSTAGDGPSWVGGTRAMPSGEIWGGNGPAAGALIGLTGAGPGRSRSRSRELELGRGRERESRQCRGRDFGGFDRSAGEASIGEGSQCSRGECRFYF
jgi:hypothetical protein